MQKPKTQTTFTRQPYVELIDPPGPLGEHSWHVLDWTGRRLLTSAIHGRTSSRNLVARRFARAVGFEVVQGYISPQYAISEHLCRGSSSPCDLAKCATPSRRSPTYVVEIIDGNEDCLTYSWRVVTPMGKFLLTSSTYIHMGTRTRAARRFARRTGLPIRTGYVDSEDLVSDQLDANAR